MSDLEQALEALNRLRDRIQSAREANSEDDPERVEKDLALASQDEAEVREYLEGLSPA